MKAGKKTLTLYWTAAGFFVLVMGWWVVFFARQGELLVNRLEDAGTGLTPEQIAAVHDAADRSLRMFIFEGGFLGLLALAGLILVLRSMRREVLLHRQQRDFLSAVTHELRSPITSARLQVESLRLGRVPPEKEDRYLSRTLEDLDRLSRTVDHVLVAARASSERVKLAMERIDLSEFTRCAVERVTDVEKSAANIEVIAPRAVHVNADSEALETIVSNLISNALKYGGEPPHVRVHVTDSEGEGTIEVRDFGPGMSESETDVVFEPFVRGGSEIVKRRPGVGLGLYLVAQLSRAIGGDVTAGNAADGDGFAVRVTLPLSNLPTSRDENLETVGDEA